MKKIIAAAALLTALAGPALAADFVTLHLTIDVAAPIDKVWSRVGGYCQMDWLGRECQFASGAGEVGTIRRLGNKGATTGNEVMIARTHYSYGYMVIDSPVNAHGNLSAEAIDAAHTRLTYDVLYDQTSLATQQDKDATRERRNKLFSDGLAKMKEIAEKP
ncbi:MAG: SRPBCC family protein [Alphaproteobacteria bacterium]